MSCQKRIENSLKIVNKQSNPSSCFYLQHPINQTYISSNPDGKIGLIGVPILFTLDLFANTEYIGIKTVEKSPKYLSYNENQNLVLLQTYDEKIFPQFFWLPMFENESVQIMFGNGKALGYNDNLILDDFKNGIQWIVEYHASDSVKLMVSNFFVNGKLIDNRGVVEDSDICVLPQEILAFSNGNNCDFNSVSFQPTNGRMLTDNNRKQKKDPNYIYPSRACATPSIYDAITVNSKIARNISEEAINKSIRQNRILSTKLSNLEVAKAKKKKAMHEKQQIIDEIKRINDLIVAENNESPLISESKECIFNGKLIIPNFDQQGCMDHNVNENVLYMQHCNGLTNQRWFTEPGIKGNVRIFNNYGGTKNTYWKKQDRNVKTCISNENGKIVLNPCSERKDQANEQWTLNNDQQIQSAGTDQCLTIGPDYHQKDKGYDPIQLKPCDKTGKNQRQQWNMNENITINKKVLINDTIFNGEGFYSLNVELKSLTIPFGYEVILYDIYGQHAKFYSNIPDLSIWAWAGRRAVNVSIVKVNNGRMLGGYGNFFFADNLHIWENRNEEGKMVHLQNGRYEKPYFNMHGVDSLNTASFNGDADITLGMTIYINGDIDRQIKIVEKDYQLSINSLYTNDFGNDVDSIDVRPNLGVKAYYVKITNSLGNILPINNGVYSGRGIQGNGRIKKIEVPYGVFVEIFYPAADNKLDQKCDTTGWCVHKEANTNDHYFDCVGDGKNFDSVCVDTFGNKGTITRSTGCTWEAWPDEKKTEGLCSRSKKITNTKTSLYAKDNNIAVEDENVTNKLTFKVFRGPGTYDIDIPNITRIDVRFIDRVVLFEDEEFKVPSPDIPPTVNLLYDVEKQLPGVPFIKIGSLHIPAGYEVRMKYAPDDIYVTYYSYHAQLNFYSEVSQVKEVRVRKRYIPEFP